MRSKLTLLFLLLMISFKALPLDNSAQISLITTSPWQEELYAQFGHTAIRVQDPTKNIDIVFNYGLFSFNQPFFAYRFAKGETDYQIGAANFPDFMIEYQMKGVAVTEQIINLDSIEKNKIWDALLINMQPENRVYRYNFFFDNCATKPRDIITKNISGTVVYPKPAQLYTFRQLTNQCTMPDTWGTFGTDLALGASSDREATAMEEMFLPEKLETAFAGAIIQKDSIQIPLVKETVQLTEAIPYEEEVSALTIFSPNTTCSLILVLCLLISFIQLKFKKQIPARIFDTILFTIAGISGCILVFLTFISEHPCMSPNWNLCWLQPLHLLIIPLIWVKRAEKGVIFYHFINFAALSIFLLCIKWIPQHFNIAFIPLILTLWSRSGSNIIYYLRNKRK